METELIIAVLAGIFSLVATVLSVLANGRIARSNDEEAARRAYEYEALKRLYTEVEPLLFQLESAAAGARDRALNLARATRSGALEGPESWLADENYYSISTVHTLVRPAVYFRLLERRITSVDLGLDASKAIVFALLREYERSFGADFDLAGTEPKLAYNPNADSELPEGSGGRFRQGVVAGRREVLVNTMILREPGEPARCATFGELESAIAADEAVRQNLSPLTVILHGFSPLDRPVHWRIIVLQAVLSSLILEALQTDQKALPLRKKLDGMIADPNWRIAHATTTVVSSFDTDTYQAVRSYLGPKLDSITQRYGTPKRK